MEENHPLRFGFWPSVILLTDHYVLVSVLSKTAVSLCWPPEKVKIRHSAIPAKAIMLSILLAQKVPLKLER